MTQPPYLVIRNVKTTSDFLKVTPLILASEGQNNESKQIRRPNFLGGGGDQPRFGKCPKIFATVGLVDISIQ